MRLPAGALVALLFVVPALPAATSSAPDLRQALRHTWFEGITEDTARAVAGEGAVPALLDMLDDPAYPRRDNVVAFLAYLGGSESTPRLTAFLQRPPRPTDIPEEERAVLLVPEALGRIAGRGDSAALSALLAMTAPGAGPSAPGPESLRPDLVEGAVHALALAGSPLARQRLQDLAAGRVVPGLRDMAPAARSELEPAPPAPSPAVSPATLDSNSRVHQLGLAWANHVSVSNPIGLTRVSSLLGQASLRAGRSDSSDDVACCIRLVPFGTARTFGSTGDGLDVIDSATELDRVLQNTVARVKIVRQIKYCGGTGTNIIGCAYTPGFGMALVRLSDFAAESVLWIHELGHNTGLNHASDPAQIMNAVDNGQNDELRQAECTRYHQPSSAARLNPVDIGACTDGDNDKVQDAVDNCPGVANFDQSDANGDGTGDVCQGTGGADGDGDGVPDVQDNCPDAFNPGQVDADRDGRGDACDPCTDADGDGWGSPGSGSCPAGGGGDCNDGNPAVHPGVFDLCNGVDDDCDGAADNEVCSALDASSDGQVDAEELGRLGRAFGLCGSSGAWWAQVDYTRDGCVDGEDLAILASGWGCRGTERVCR